MEENLSQMCHGGSEVVNQSSIAHDLHKIHVDRELVLISVQEAVA